MSIVSESSTARNQNFGEIFPAAFKLLNCGVVLELGGIDGTGFLPPCRTRKPRVRLCCCTSINSHFASWRVYAFVSLRSNLQSSISDYHGSHPIDVREEEYGVRVVQGARNSGLYHLLTSAADGFGYAPAKYHIPYYASPPPPRIQLNTAGGGGGIHSKGFLTNIPTPKPTLLLPPPCCSSRNRGFSLGVRGLLSAK